MCKIAIIGWYGTETIGDRAILCGILKVISSGFQSFEIQIGALYPTLTERTILEDYPFFKKCIGKDFRISVFDSSKITQLKRAIRWCDILSVGGGPLMDISGMLMLDYSFSYAKSLKKKTALLGCGWGPLKETRFVGNARKLIKNSDLILMRDQKSVNQCVENTSDLLRGKKVEGLIDPAFFAAKFFIENQKPKERNESIICINLRDMHYGASNRCPQALKVNLFLKDIIKETAERYKEREILLVPMHTFSIGGDDRYILNGIAQSLKLDNITVQNNPLSLEETMSKYYNAWFCIGMRFHSIVLETLLNGKNYILDYTDPLDGKIVSMLQQLQLQNCYNERYISLYGNIEQKLEIDGNIQRKEFPLKAIEIYYNNFVAELSRLIK